jgi:DNA-binding NtrC family response regulator
MRLLIIGSLDGQVVAASKIAMARGAKVVHADDIDSGLQSLRTGQSTDLVMIDVKLDVARLVRSLAAEHFHIPVVAAGVTSDAQAAVRAIRAGAKEYVPLPPDPELIAAVIEAVTEESHAIVCRGAAMHRLLALADQVAASDASVLITGESGTGKELIARYLHRKSLRAEKPFVSVNCAAIPENLLESELFGHEKGAFTGAVARRIGKFEQANGGTLLLDEISEMDLRLQAKLLRAIQEREIDRVGGMQPIRVDIRILATSNRPLQDVVRRGQFREDLYFRINVVTLTLPPLRDRPDDIDSLADHFGRRYAESNGLPQRPFAPEARSVLRAHPWPGNVRELENTIHRAVLLARGDVIGPEAVALMGDAAPAAEAGNISNSAAAAVGRAASTDGLIGKTLADVERDLILDTLKHYLGNRTHAANILGISIRTLRNKLKQYSDSGADVPMPRDHDRRAMI